MGLTSKDVKLDMKEYLDLEKFKTDTFQYAIIKGIRLIIRLVLTIRSNQVRIMKKVGAEMIESKRTYEETESK